MDRIVENFLNPEVLAAAFPAVLAGFWVTVQAAVVIILLGVGVGLLLAVLRLAAIRPLDVLIAAYIDVFRTLPQLVILVVLYFGGPYAGLVLSPFATTSIALGAVLSAFAAEIFWAAIMALPKGQWEAARALGLRPLVTIFVVIMPQAVRLATPLLTNRAIAITKGTALGVAVALPETLGSAQSVMAIMANPSPLTLAAAFYLLFFIPLVILSRVIEQRFAPAN